MTPARPTILLTGFGPFPGVPVNVSATLVKGLLGHARKAFPSARLIADTLPTEWEIAPERAAELIAAHEPDIALHFGVSNRATGFVIETRARNATGRADAAGITPDENSLDAFGPEALPTLLPAGRLTARLKRLGLPAALSRDAGDYLCNAVFYRSVRMQNALAKGGISGFIHLPVGFTAPARGVTPYGLAVSPTLSLDDAITGGLEILATCLGRPPHHRANPAATLKVQCATTHRPTRLPAEYRQSPDQPRYA